VGETVRDLTIGDRTQRALLPVLERTEGLLSKVASTVNGLQCDAEVVALTDLGIATNPGRMSGGFFTGAHYRWEGEVPMVPVDATVNVCSVSVHRVDQPPTTEAEFFELIGAAEERCGRETEYRWNLADGNHFASLGGVVDSTSIPDGDYLVLHHSASEFKRTPGGLYPESNVWFADDVREVNDGVSSLRYIAGAPAERFIQKAHSLVSYTEERHRVLARLIGDQLRLAFVDCLPHYGMPDEHSVAIGCHWMPSSAPRWFLLLTEPDARIPIITPRRGTNLVQIGGAEHMLTPHGLGVRGKDDLMDSLNDGSEPGNSEISGAPEMLDRDDTEWRSIERSPELLRRILGVTPGDVDGWFTPRFSYHRGRR
jgi:hypothetical protein